jgi:hypothetical protein
VKPPQESVRRQAECANPRWIVTPRYKAGAPAHLEAVPKGRAFMHLIQSSFDYDLHGKRGFELLAGVVEACDIYDFTYSSLEEAVAVFDDLTAAA